MSNENSGEPVAVLEFPALGIAGDEVTPEASSERVTGIVLGRLVALQSSKRALVALKGLGASQTVEARRVVGLTDRHVGREVALMFEEGDPARPTIIGLIEVAPPPRAEADDARKQVAFDAETIVLNGEKEIILRCGDASVTLTREGKVLIRGAHLLSRSSGVNRIKGGSVQIN